MIPLKLYKRHKYKNVSVSHCDLPARILLVSVGSAKKETFRIDLKDSANKILWMDSSIAAQTLGAIVQAYASILAIARAFYIFLIERTRSELKDARDRLENTVDVFYMNATNDRAEFYDNLMNCGIDYLNELAERWPNFTQRQEYLELVQRYQIYTSLKKRTSMWAFRLFRGVFFYVWLSLAALHIFYMSFL